MQTGRTEGVVEDAVERWDTHGCSTWNIRSSIDLSVPRGTLNSSADVQNAVFCTRKRPGLPPPATQHRLSRRIRSAEQTERACRCDKARGNRKHRDALIHGTHPHSVEAPGGKKLCPGRVNASAQLKGPERFLKECRLLPLRLGQSHVDRAAAKSDRDSGNAGPGAKIERSRGFRVVRGSKNAFHQVTLDEFCRIPDSR